MRAVNETADIPFMQLSAEWFQRVVEGLHSDEAMTRRHGKRKEGRVGVRCAISVTSDLMDDMGKKEVRVTVRDISPSGMGFISHVQMVVGHLLVCHLPRDEAEPLSVEMTVRNCRRISQGLYGVGVSFGRVLAKAPSETAETSEASSI